MAFLDLEDGIEELFQEQQDRYAGEAAACAFALEGYALGGRKEFTGQLTNIGRPARAKSGPEKCRMRRYMQERRMGEIEERLLAGERPSIPGPGQPGRRPTRWITAAAKLGIELPVAQWVPKTPAPETAERKAAKGAAARATLDAGIRVRLLAGERLKARGRPSKHWARLAAELGISLHPAA